MLKKSLLLLGCSVLLCASTTMCYKKDHLDPETIEKVPLKGGACDDKFSISDMKQKGYMVDDIKISMGKSGMDYIYILKDGSTSQTTTNGAVSLTPVELRKQFKAFQVEEKKKAKEKKRVDSIANGEKRYNELCKKCHGDGSIKAYNVARPLLSLDKRDFELAISEFQNDQRKGQMVLLMKPYANLLGVEDVENIYNYLETLKK